jgi:hypothetical protein
MGIVLCCICRGNVCHRMTQEAKGSGVTDYDNQILRYYPTTGNWVLNIPNQRYPANHQHHMPRAQLLPMLNELFSCKYARFESSVRCSRILLGSLTFLFIAFQIYWWLWAPHCYEGRYDHYKNYCSWIFRDENHTLVGSESIVIFVVLFWILSGLVGCCNAVRKRSVKRVLSRWNAGTFMAGGMQAELCGSLGTWINISYRQQIVPRPPVQIQPDPLANAIVRRPQPPRNQPQAQVSMNVNSQVNTRSINPSLGNRAPNFQYTNMNSRAEPLLPEIENINIRDENSFPNQHAQPLQVRNSHIQHYPDIENANYPMAPQSQFFPNPNNGDYHQM